MNKAIILRQSYADYIDRIEERSDACIKRMRIFFKNGYELSIVRGMGTYGDEEGLFEIMPSSEELIDKQDKGDSVVGYLSIDRVNYYIEKIGKAKPE